VGPQARRRAPRQRFMGDGTPGHGARGMAEEPLRNFPTGLRGYDRQLLMEITAREVF
jgi:hypothetical protein